MPDLQAELETAMQEFKGEPMSPQLSERVAARCKQILKEAIVRGEVESIHLEFELSDEQ